MLRILLPVDGSENALHAVNFLLKKAALFREPLDIHLLNVQLPYPNTIHSGHQQTKQERQEQGLAMLTSARKLLDAADVKYTCRVDVGEAPTVIARYVEEHGIEQVVMGTRGHGTIAGMLLGSVATKVLHLVHVPVLLVPHPPPAIKRLQTKSSADSNASIN
jgi:nucleotide-binding universal stress UspA family protein